MSDNQMPAVDEHTLRGDVFNALRELQLQLEEYRNQAKKPPTFLIGNTAPEIPNEQLEGCKLLSNRDLVLNDIPKGSIGVEVGTQFGWFARKLLSVIQPQSLSLIDITFERFEREKFKDELASQKLKLLEGTSWEVLDSNFPDRSLDFIYIDAGHSYEAVSKDLEVAIRKIKKGGLITCNDYVPWSIMEATPYGVHRAVSETIVAHKCVVTHYALHNMGYNDIAFKLLD